MPLMPILNYISCSLKCSKEQDLGLSPARGEGGGGVERGAASTVSVLSLPSKPWVKAKPQKSCMKASLLTRNQDTAP